MKKKTVQNNCKYQNENIDRLLKDALIPNEKPSQELNTAIIKKVSTPNQKIVNSFVS